MQYTLLQMTQDILSSMDGDSVNSVSDTVESDQVVTVIKTVYDDIVSRLELPVQYQTFNLTPSGDSTKPVLMTKSSVIDNLKWIRYDCQILDALDPMWMEVSFLCLEEFTQMTQRLNPSETTVDTMTVTLNGMTVSFFYRNDKYPQYYTTVDDNTLIFDSYDSAVDTTLQSSKTMCYGEYSWTFQRTDTWIPHLRPNEFSYLYNQAKALAWAELRQMNHPMAEKMARRQEVQLQKTKRAVPVDQDHSGPNYGRKRSYANWPYNR